MARSFHDGVSSVIRLTGQKCERLVGAGNGLRENAVLAGLVSDAFGMSLRFPRHREEAAYGAALLAGVGAGMFSDLATAGRVIQYS
jgi:sugar (pentulose or hexulose) kinase